MAVSAGRTGRLGSRSDCRSRQSANVSHAPWRAPKAMILRTEVSPSRIFSITWKNSSPTNRISASASFTMCSTSGGAEQQLEEDIAALVEMGDAALRLDAVRHQAVGDAARCLVERAVGGDAAGMHEGCGVGTFGRMSPHDVCQSS